MSVGMQVNSLQEKNSSNPLLLGAGIGLGLGTAVSSGLVAVGRSSCKNKLGIDSFEAAQKFIKNCSEIRLGSVIFSKENFLKAADNIFKSSVKYIAKSAAVCGAIGFALGGLVALCKSDKN